MPNKPFIKLFELSGEETREITLSNFKKLLSPDKICVEIWKEIEDNLIENRIIRQEYSYAMNKIYDLMDATKHQDLNVIN